MAQKVIRYTRFTCDRCGHSEDANGPPTGWAKLNGQKMDTGGPALLARYEVEICDGCATVLRSWFAKTEAA